MDTTSQVPARPRRPGQQAGTGRSLALTLASAVVPGSGLIGSRWRKLGVLTTCLTVLALLAGLALVKERTQLLRTLGSSSGLRKFAVGLLVVALVWAALIVTTHALTRPAHASRGNRIGAATVVGVLCFAVAAPLAVAAEYARVTANALGAVTKDQNQTKSQTRPTIVPTGNTKEGWPNKPRVNILLVGLDDRADRGNQKAGTVNTDTIMVASIDTKTGDAVIIQVPRNMARTPFPAGSDLAKAYPEGFFNGNANDAGSWVNSIWTNVPAEHPELFTNTDFKGADALKLAIQGALQIPIDYFVSLDIDGLEQLIDAMGGVTINVSHDAPIGGSTDPDRPPIGWIKQGPNQHLDGYHAVWYARGRYHVDDYVRMAKQSCVIKAVIDQADPATLATKFTGIVKAGSDMFKTDIPQQMAPSFLELALKVKDAHQSRVLFEHLKDGYVTTNPDFAMMRARVAAAIKASTSGAASPSASPTSTKPASSPTSSASGSTGQSTPGPSSSTSGSVAPGETLTDACAYNP